MGNTNIFGFENVCIYGIPIETFMKLNEPKTREILSEIKNILEGLPDEIKESFPENVRKKLDSYPEAKKYFVKNGINAWIEGSVFSAKEMEKHFPLSPEGKLSLNDGEELYIVDGEKLSLYQNLAGLCWEGCSKGKVEIVKETGPFDVFEEKEKYALFKREDLETLKEKMKSLTGEENAFRIPLILFSTEISYFSFSRLKRSYILIGKELELKYDLRKGIEIIRGCERYKEGKWEWERFGIIEGYVSLEEGIKKLKKIDGNK